MSEPDKLAELQKKVKEKASAIAEGKRPCGKCGIFMCPDGIVIEPGYCTVCALSLNKSRWDAKR